MPVSTDILPDHFSGSYHLLVNPVTQFVPTGYDKEALTALTPDLERIETGVTFERTEDADGAKLLIKLAFEKGKNINGFYYYDETHELQQRATGLYIVCRSIVEVSAEISQQHSDDAIQDSRLTPLVDREFFFVDSVGRQKGVVSWLELIAEGSQILAYKAYMKSKFPPILTPTQL